MDDTVNDPGFHANLGVLWSGQSVETETNSRLKPAELIHLGKFRNQTSDVTHIDIRYRPLSCIQHSCSQLQHIGTG